MFHVALLHCNNRSFFRPAQRPCAPPLYVRTIFPRQVDTGGDGRVGEGRVKHAKPCQMYGNMSHVSSGGDKIARGNISGRERGEKPNLEQHRTAPHRTLGPPGHHRVASISRHSEMDFSSLQVFLFHPFRSAAVSAPCQESGRYEVFAVVLEVHSVSYLCTSNLGSSQNSTRL